MDQDKLDEALAFERAAELLERRYPEAVKDPMSMPNAVTAFLRFAAKGAREEM